MGNCFYDCSIEYIYHNNNAVSLRNNIKKKIYSVNRKVYPYISDNVLY